MKLSRKLPSAVHILCVNGTEKNTTLFESIFHLNDAAAFHITNVYFSGNIDPKVYKLN